MKGFHPSSFAKIADIRAHLRSKKDSTQMAANIREWPQIWMR